MIDSHYMAMHKQASLLQQKLQHYTQSVPHDAHAYALNQHMRGLTNALAQHKDPRIVENHIRQIQTHMQTAPTSQSALSHGAPIMSYNQKNYMGHAMTQMRQNIRSHPNWS